MNRPVTVRDSLKVREWGFGETAVPEQATNTSIKEDTIYVWSARYSTLGRYYPFLSALLSPEESRKATGFKKTGDSRRYILRRGMVRAVLGHSIHEKPENLRFVQGINGKPDLDPDGKFPDIRFSLSRTDEMVCLALTRKSEIGVDIVRPQNHYSFSAIGHYLFTPGERKWVAQTIPGRRSMRFFKVWALKEALLKATGGDVRTMKDADVSPLMTDTFLDGFYTVNLGEKDQRCFIHESGCGAGHHRVFTTLPVRKKDPDN